jgi:hypothetical protein
VESIVRKATPEKRPAAAHQNTRRMAKATGVAPELERF